MLGGVDSRRKVLVIELFTMAGIFLIGFMGSGKSSLGKRLSERLDRPFVDLDECLVDRFGASISRVFSEHGEEAFRLAEREELSRVVALDNVVVATGGGAFCSPENRELIEASGAISVFLDLPWGVLCDRLQRGGNDRPLFVDSEQARALFEARLPQYRMATVVVDLDGRETVAEVVERVAGAVQEAPCAI